jgi:adenine/guanine phosphoribosyltransferase-like PRPP-binding protein
MNSRTPVHSSSTCSCSEPGFCARRNVVISSVHFARCQKGECEMLDILYSRATASRAAHSRKTEVSGHGGAANTGLNSGIGTRLEKIIERETGEHMPCSGCRQEVLRLNELTRDQVTTEIDSIVEGIVRRGKENLGWWSAKRWAISLLPDQVKDRVRLWLTESLEGASEAAAAGDRKESESAGLSSRDQQIARGIAAGVSRAEVIRARKNWTQMGIPLPPLESRGSAAAIRPFVPASKSAVAVAAGGRHWASAFTRTCIYLGEAIGMSGCSCGPGRKTQFYRCNHSAGPEQCCLSDRDLLLIRDATHRNGITSCQSCSLRADLPRFISSQQYMRDVAALASRVPPEVSTIAGVARSGLCAATMISMLLHLPMDIVRQQQGDIIPGGNGWRLQKSDARSHGTVLVVDDTCMTGNSLRSIAAVVRNHYGDRPVAFATVYANPLATTKPDFWAVDLPWPHLLEWNLFNSVLLPACAMDFDGILCHDCPPGSDDDGERYRQFLENTLPMYPVRRQAIPLVVTARLEKYRESTQRWLDRWGIQVNRLVMGPWETLQERSRSDVAAYKAQHYGEFLQTRVSPGPHLFIESDARQAQRIAELTRGIVVCPAAGRCFS